MNNQKESYKENKDIDPLGDIIGKISSFAPELGSERLVGKVIKKGPTHYDHGYMVPDCSLTVEGRSGRRMYLDSYICSHVYLFDSYIEADNFNKNGWKLSKILIK